MHNLGWPEWVWQLRVLKVSRLPQDCLFFSFFPSPFLLQASKAFFFCCCLQKLKTWQTRTKRPDVTHFSTPASAKLWGLWQRENVGWVWKKKDQDCGPGSVKPSVSQLELGLMQSAAKAIYFSEFHHFSNKKKNEKVKHSVKSCLKQFFFSM